MRPFLITCIAALSAPVLLAQNNVDTAPPETFQSLVEQGGQIVPMNGPEGLIAGVQLDNAVYSCWLADRPRIKKHAKTCCWDI